MVTKDCDQGCRGKHSRKFPFFRNPFVFVVLWLVLAVAIGAIIMLLWNWLMPVIFGLPVLSLWQALGLFVLTRILFGSFGFGRRGMPGRGGNPVHEKWMGCSNTRTHTTITLNTSNQKSMSRNSRG